MPDQPVCSSHNCTKEASFVVTCLLNDGRLGEMIPLCPYCFAKSLDLYRDILKRLTGEKIDDASP